MKTLKEYLEAPGGKEQLESCVSNILLGFNFKKVAKVMDFLDWKWAGKDGGFYVPNEKEILLFANRLIKTTIDDFLDAESSGDDTSYGWCSKTGGFECKVSIADDETRKYFFGEDAEDNFENSVDIILKFVLEDNFGKFC